jgi:hypothetical protein
MTQELIYNAGIYLAQGISITLTDSRKVSIGPWKELQNRLITEAELQDRAAKAEGIAIICGAISGNLEVIDIDLKYDTTGNLFERMQDAIPSALLDKLLIARTKSGGYHLYYRCSSVLPNSKLARRPSTEQERIDNPHVSVFVLIETRGEGGYVVAPPSAGYQWLHGNTIDHLMTITDAERDQLWEICRSFNEYLEEPKKHIKTESEASFGVSPIDDFNARGSAVDILVKHGWSIVRENSERIYLRRPGKTEGTSGDWHKEKRWFSVFTTSSQFEPTTAYSAAAVFCMLECGNDWKQAVKTLAANGYGEDINTTQKKKLLTAKVHQLRSEGLSNRKIQEHLEEIGLKPKAAKAAIADADNPTEEEGYFWSRNDKGKLVINKMKMLEFLSEQGFYLMAYDDAGNDMRLVQIKDYIIEESSIEKVKKTIFDYARPIDVEVAQWLINNHHLVSNSFLEFIPRIAPDFLTDDERTAYFPFRNCIAVVTKDKVDTITYGSCKKHIWKSSKIDFDFRPDSLLNEDLIFTFTPSLYDYPDFIQCITGRDSVRFAAACSIIGYLLHSYKDATRPFAVILAEETDNDAKGGGTGKGIFVKAVSKLLKTETIDGKTFRQDKSFLFQRIGWDTRLMVIQDARAKLDFEGLYSIITEGITVEKKGQDEFYIPFEKSPKIIITTNYSVSSDGVHAQRRQKVLPFADFFGAKLTPLEYFGKQLFDGWDVAQWSIFYNFMLDCVRQYLNHGILETQINDGMRLKAIKVKYGEEFRNWWDEFRQSKLGEEIEFKNMYEYFMLFSDFSEVDFPKKRFKQALLFAANQFNYVISEARRNHSGAKSLKIDGVK